MSRCTKARTRSYRTAIDRRPNLTWCMSGCTKARTRSVLGGHRPPTKPHLVRVWMSSDTHQECSGRSSTANQTSPRACLDALRHAPGVFWTVIDRQPNLTWCFLEVTQGSTGSDSGGYQPPTKPHLVRVWKHSDTHQECSRRVPAANQTSPGASLKSLREAPGVISAATDRQPNLTWCFLEVTQGSTGSDFGGYRPPTKPHLVHVWMH